MATTITKSQLKEMIKEALLKEQRGERDTYEVYMAAQQLHQMFEDGDFDEQPRYSDYSLKETIVHARAYINEISAWLDELEKNSETGEVEKKPWFMDKV